MSIKRLYQLFFAFLALLFDLTGKDSVNYVKAFMTVFVIEIFYIQIASVVLLQIQSPVVRWIPALFNPSLEPMILATAVLFALNLLIAGPRAISEIKDEIRGWPDRKLRRGYVMSCCVLVATLILFMSSMLFVVATVPMP